MVIISGNVFLGKEMYCKHDAWRELSCCAFHLRLAQMSVLFFLWFDGVAAISAFWTYWPVQFIINHKLYEPCNIGFITKH